MTARYPVKPTPLETPCIEWEGATDWGGYGIEYREGRNVRVHRRVWIDANGELPKDVFVCHRCDNPPCYRLDHLFAGTGKDNADDREAKGRSPRTHPWQGRQWGKLTNEQVEEISDRYGEPPGRGRRKRGEKFMTQKQIAALYGVSQVAISRVLRTKTYT